MQWEQPLPGSELGEVEYAISRQQWRARQATEGRGTATRELSAVLVDGLDNGRLLEETDRLGVVGMVGQAIPASSTAPRSGSSDTQPGFR